MAFSLLDYGLVFLSVFGYVCIIQEQRMRLNKSMVALFMGLLSWLLLFCFTTDRSYILQHFEKHLAEISQIILFLLGAMAIVECINAHDGLLYVAKFFNVNSKKALLWIVGILAFFLSAILDNLTTTLVLIALLKKMIPQHEERLHFGALVVLAANAGGAWTPIGDITTTMLWVGGQLSTWTIIQNLFLPSIACFVVATSFFSCKMKGACNTEFLQYPISKQSKFVLLSGIITIILVPIIHTITYLPPAMCMLISMASMWLIVDLILGNKKNSKHLQMLQVLSKVDLPGVFFFLGILLSISALETQGILAYVARYIDTLISSQEQVTGVLGIISAILGNVPIIAAAMGMYTLDSIPKDAVFWQLLAYCAGVGANIFIIGSAAGIAFMAQENVSVSWYVRKVTVPAFISYIIGFLVYLVMQ